MLDKWDVKVINLETTFNELECNGGGKLIFSEFCSWAASKNMDIENDSISVNSRFDQSINESFRSRDSSPKINPSKLSNLLTTIKNRFLNKDKTI